ncbi:hypothetical protein D9M70_553110 [compost metagenome]
MIALPLQKQARARNASVFVDEDLVPYCDQWAFLASLQPMRTDDIEPAIVRAIGHRHPLDVIGDETEERQPWEHQAPRSRKLICPLPAALNVTLANQVTFNKSELPQPLSNQFIRLAAFWNPDFY